MDKRTLNATLGILAREARRKSRQSLVDVGRKIGCNKQNVSHLELGDNGWSVERLVSYARAVNASPTHLLRVALLRHEGQNPQPDSHEEPQVAPAVRAP